MAIPFKLTFGRCDLIAGVLVVLAAAGSAHADIVISSAATSNVTCSSGVCTPSSSNAVLNVGDLETLLASGNVKLAAAGEPVDVDIEVALSWVSTNTLTLDSYHSINVQLPVAITGGGGLAITTNDGGTGGVFDFAPGANVAIWSLSSRLTINGSAYTLVGDIATLASDIAATRGGFYALAGNYDAKPDGTYSQCPIATSFTGAFQGLGNTISNVSISNSTKAIMLGFFCVNDSGASIANLELQKIEIIGGDAVIGGIVATNEGLLFGDHVSGNLNGGRRATIGGVTGSNISIVGGSSSSASLQAPDTAYIGGLVGIHNGTISTSYATGPISNGSSIGGLVGYNYDGAIINSYAIGPSKGGKSAEVGGLIGTLYSGTVSDSYSTGHVAGGSESEVGGFLGLLTSGTASQSYWDTTTSKTKNAAGSSKEIPGVKGLTTKRLQSGLPSGFDPTIWAENPSINKGFPYLIGNPPQ